MKRIACILLALTTLATQLVKAQTCPTTATYTNQSGTFDLTSGKTILLNGGKSYQITIQNDFSSTSSICVLNGSTLYLTFQNVNNMGKGGFINVDKNATLSINSSINNFPLTINNSGTTTQSGAITYADGATIVNSGTYSIPTSVTLNSGTVTFTNSGSLNISGSLNYNNGTFTMTNAANSNISISGNLLLSNTTIKNLGNFTVSGDVTLQSASVITNNGYMTLSGALAFSGATFTNNGIIYSSGSTTINTGSTFNNNCTIKSSGSFSTNGTVSNSGNIILASSFTNQGTFTNGTNGWVQGTGDFNNNGTITGSGNFYFVGTTTNQGPFNGTSSSSPINFYDATLNNGKSNYFDNQNTNPTNTTKNKISPNNATSFTSCADLSEPEITSQPTTQMLCSSSTTEARFSVTATSKNTPTYQWYKNGVAVLGATSSTYSATGLSFADTSNIYYAAVTNTAGTTYSNKVYAKYVILTQPSSLDIAVGSTATFTVSTAWATGYQWQKNSSDISGATSTIYAKTNVALADSGSYAAIVTYSGGTCTSNTAKLVVENLPVITTQPQKQMLCSNAVTSATFGVAATSTSDVKYQWYKNGTPIADAKSSSYTATGLSYTDTTSLFYVVLTNNVGSTTSNSVSVKYVILNQPSSLYLGIGTTASFTVVASGATGYQWQKAGATINGTSAATYSKTNIALTDAGSYTAVVSYSGGTCTSNAAVLTVESLPSITTQPQSQVLCNSSTTATFSVTVTKGISNLSYQWYKNNSAVAGATSSSYLPTGLTMADTANTYYVAVTNGIGTVKSNSIGFKYLLTSQPLSQVVATGNKVSFWVGVSGSASYQWQKKGVSIAGATSSTYTLPAVNYSDSGKYTVQVFTTGATACSSDTAVLKTSITLYSKASGDCNLPSTWGVATDGSGSSPLDFTRNEHTFILANRSSLSTAATLTIAGTVDVANGKLTITPNTTLTAGRIIRSAGSTGAIVSSSSSNLSLTGISTISYSGSSDLYFDTVNDTLHNLTIAAHTATLHTALAITGGKTAGRVQVNSGGMLLTSDSLTLKSDINGTASIASSAGTITGKVTIEKFIHARRAWRLMNAPITSVNAPTINAAWQEGAASSTDNPHPGFGTHITYGAVADGFDQNPQKTFSMKVYNSTTNSWTGVPATKTTTITNYPAYFIFIRGNRSYSILTTTGYMAPMTTVLRATGNVNQGTLAAQAVSASGFTLTANPYASPVNFTKLISAGKNIKTRYWVWDPTLAGTYGVGAWVTVDGSTGTYKSVPPSAYVAGTLEAGQGFFVQTSDGKTAGSLQFSEAVKDSTLSTTSADRMGGNTADTSLQINLKLFNADTTTAIADGVLFSFGSSYSDSVDNGDAVKMGNTSENLGIKADGHLLTIDERTMPKTGDSLQLNLTNAQSASYQFEIVPSSLGSAKFLLYDKYLNTLSPISSTDTTRINFIVNNSIAASQAANRFVIVMQKTKITNTVSPVLFTTVKAYAQEKAINVEWKVSNETGIMYYEVQKSTDGTSFSAVGNVVANGSSFYLFTDAAPATGINYYRIKSVSKTGEVHYTSIVNAQVQAGPTSNGTPLVSVYPNPFTGTQFTLTLTNQAAGTYDMSIINQNGAIQFSKQIVHNGGTTSQKISLNNRLAAGVYYIKIASATGTVNMLKVEAQ